MFDFGTLTRLKESQNGDMFIDINKPLDMSSLKPEQEADPNESVKAEPFFPDIAKQAFRNVVKGVLPALGIPPNIVPPSEEEQQGYDDVGRALNIPQQALYGFAKDPTSGEAWKRAVGVYEGTAEPITASELYKDTEFKPLTLGLNIPFAPIPIRIDAKLNEEQTRNLVTMYTDVFANPLYLAPLAVRTIGKVAGINWTDVATKVKYGKVPKMPPLEKVFTTEEINAVFGSALEKKAYMKQFGVPAWKNLSQFAGEYNSLLKGVIPQGGTVFYSGIPLDGKSIRQIAKTLNISAPIVEKIAKGINVAGLSQGIVEQVKGMLNEFVPKPEPVAPIEPTQPALKISKLEQEALKYDNAKDFIAKIQGSATQYEQYTPEYREMGIEGYENISKLGIDPEDTITIYRGIDDISKTVKREIKDGDFVTTDYDSALAYTGSPDDVVTMEVKAKDLYVAEADDFKEEPFYVGAEYIYTTKVYDPLTSTKLKDIWEKAHAQAQPETKTELAPKDFPTAEEYVKAKLPDGGKFIEESTKENYDRIKKEAGGKGVAEVIDEGGLKHIMHKSTKEKGSWQVTVFNKDGLPMSDGQFKNPLDAVKELADNAPLRKDLPDDIVFNMGKYEHIYKTKNARGVGLGTVPKENLIGNDGWDKAIYSTPLSREQMNQYELEPFSFRDAEKPLKAELTKQWEDAQGKGVVKKSEKVVKPSKIEKLQEKINTRQISIETAKTQLEALEPFREFLKKRIKVSEYEGVKIPRRYVSKEGMALDLALDEINNALGTNLQNENELVDYLVDLEKSASELNDIIKENRPIMHKKSDISELKKTIRDIQTGIKEGKKSGIIESKDTTKAIIELLQTVKLPADLAWKHFIKKIQNINTWEQLNDELKNLNKKIGEVLGQVKKRELKASIEKELKTTKPVKSGTKMVGKYDYESNKFFDDLRTSYNMNQADAQKALDEMPTENLTEMELIKARFLSLKANGAKASLQLYNKVLEDIQNLKLIGQAVKDDASFDKKVNLRKNIDEVSTSIETVKQIPIIENLYLEGVSNMWSLLNGIGGKSVADKYNTELLENRKNTEIHNVTVEDNDKVAEILGLDSGKKVPKYFAELEKTEHIISGDNGITHTISNNHIMHIYNGVKNEMIRDRYYNAFGEVQINELIENLTEAEKEVADFWMENVQGYKDIFNERSIEITGRDNGYVDEYWPATSEFDVSVYDDIKMQGEIPSAMKGRVNSTKVIPKMARASTVYNKHINQAHHIKNISREYEQLRRVFTDRKIKNQIVNKFGEKIYNLLLTKIEDMSLNKKTAMLDAIDKGYSWLLNNWVSAKIASPSVFLTQLGSAINYAEDMPVGEWSSGFLQGVLSPVETFNYMWKTAPFLEARFNKGYKEALQEAIRGAEEIALNSRGGFRKGLTSLTRIGDISAIIYGGYPYLKNLIAKYNNIQKAVDEFEIASLRSQQSPLTSSLSEVQKDKGGFKRTLMAFKNTPMQYLRKVADAIISYNNGDMSAEKLAKTLIIYSLLNPIIYSTSKAPWWIGTSLLATAVGRAVRGEEQETPDLEEIGKDVGLNALTQLIASPFSAIPVIDDIIKAIAVKMVKDKAPYQVMTLPVLSDLEVVMKKILTKKELTLMDYLETLGTATEMSSGLPVQMGLSFAKDFIGDGKTVRERKRDKQQEDKKEKRKEIEEKKEKKRKERKKNRR